MIAGNANLVAVDLDPELDRAAWTAARLQGIGGSDAAAVLGESTQKSAIDVWLERTTGVAAFAGNERTHVGTLLEPILLDWFAAGQPKWPRDGGPLHVVKPPTVYHRERPWQRGSADGFGFWSEQIANILVNGVAAPALLLARKPSFLVEIKTHGWFGSRGYTLDDEDNPVLSVPPDKRIQCAWYMGLYDVDLTYLVALVDTHLRRTFALHRDRELEAMVLETVSDFWHQHVLTGEPPPPDGTTRYRGYLGQRFKSHTAELVAATPEVEKAAAALLSTKRQQKTLEKDRELAEQVIKRHIGENAGVKTSLGAITWKSQPSGKLRDKEVRAELYAALGYTDDDIDTFETKYQQPPHRVLRTPK